MALENLIKNIEEEKRIAREMLVISSSAEIHGIVEAEIAQKSLRALKALLRIINNSIPELANNVSPLKSLSEPKEIKNLVSIKFSQEGIEKNITINRADKKKFFDELSLGESALSRLRKSSKIEADIPNSGFKAPSLYARYSNILFSKLSNNLVEKGKFRDLAMNLRKANIPFMFNTYISMIFFSALIASAFSLILFIFLIFFSLSIDYPFIIAQSFSLQRILINFLFCLLIPVIAFFSAYSYPYLEAKSFGKKVSQELPFVAMHMSAISGSGIEPTQIFKIIALGREYPNTKKEIKKVINQVNLYGYDLVSALKNSAKSTSSPKLAELFNGLATTISTGGSLSEFLDKRTETLLFDYKLDKEKSTKMAETFMDIYISVVIAAPMIMMLLMILLSVGPINIGLGISALTFIIISLVILINMVFLGVLHLRHTEY